MARNDFEDFRGLAKREVKKGDGGKPVPTNQYSANRLNGYANAIEKKYGSQARTEFMKEFTSKRHK